MSEHYFVKLDKRLIKQLDGDLALVSWLAILRDYAARFRTDNLGFTRVKLDVIKEDYGFYAVKVWRLNKKLEEAGLVEIDKVPRGGRRYMGFKLKNPYSKNYNN